MQPTDTTRSRAVVTGASSGIGLELAKQFATHGFDLIVAAEDDAGTGAGGAFATDTDLEQELELVDLNVRSTVHLAKHVVRDMAGKERVVSASLSTKLPGRGSRFLPDSVKAKMHRGMAEPGSAEKE